MTNPALKEMTLQSLRSDMANIDDAVRKLALILDDLQAHLPGADDNIETELSRAKRGLRWASSSIEEVIEQSEQGAA